MARAKKRMWGGTAVVALLLALVFVLFNFGNFSSQVTPQGEGTSEIVVIAGQQQPIPIPIPIPMEDPLYPPVRKSTNVVFRQVGLIVPLNGSKKDNILPLMGRTLAARRSLWQYYSVSNQRNGVKLPVFVKNKSGLSEYGVDEVFNGDTVGVGGLNEVYRVELYENNSTPYSPFI